MLQTKQLRLLFHSSSFPSLSFFLRHQASPFFSSFTLFSSQSHCFSLFLSDITLSFFFSLFSSFTPIFVAVVFFFLHWFDTRFDSGWVEMVIGGSLVVGCDGQIQWWVGRLVMGESVVVGSVVRNRWMGSESVNCWCKIGEWVLNQRNRWCEIDKSMNG